MGVPEMKYLHLPLTIKVSLSKHSLSRHFFKSFFMNSRLEGIYTLSSTLLFLIFGDAQSAL